MQVGLVVLVSSISLALGEAAQGLEEKLRDPWFADPARQVRLDPDIRLVYIDDESLEKLRAPSTFWAPHFAKLGAALVAAKAKVVGLDWLPYDVDAEVFQTLLPAYPELGPIEDNPWLPLHQALQSRPQSLVQGIFPPNFQHPLPGSRAPEHYRPASELMAMVGPRQLAFLNLSRDRDGVLRQQVALPLQLLQPLWGANSFAPFFTRMAEVASSQQVDPQRPQWAGRALPLSASSALRINYPPRQHQLPATSLSTVLEWAAQSDPRLLRNFANKVVFVGPGTPIFQDLVQTPVGEMYGVDAHAYAYNTLISGQWLQSAGLGAKAGLTLALAGLGLWMGVALAPAFLGPLVALVGWVFWGWTRWMFVRHSWMGPLLHPLAGLILSAAWGAAWRGLVLARQQRYVRQLFGRYVSPAVMETLLKDPEQTALGAIGKRKITVLFTDINGFSTHCEKKTPELIMKMLNRYFEAMNRIIFQHGGTIKQFVGDEIMALYGAPIDHPKSAEAAVLTVLEMVRELEAQRAQDPEEEQGFYYIKAGIHTGEVILGNVGSHERTEYAAVGDDVNLGSRLMGMTKALKADILISRDVYEQVSHLPNIIFEPKGKHPVKGRQEPIEIYSVKEATP